MDTETKLILNVMSEAIMALADKVYPERQKHFIPELNSLKQAINSMNDPLEISKYDVQYLREYTGESMIACKNALVKAKGDLQAAIQILHRS